MTSISEVTWDFASIGWTADSEEPVEDVIVVPVEDEAIVVPENEVIEEFKLDVAIGAVTASPDDLYWLTLEIDFKLSSYDVPISKDNWVWMYSQIQNKGASTVPETWETVSCLV